MNTLAVRADPGGAVADPPLVFREAVRADGKTAGTAPAEGKFVPAAMTGVVFPAPATSGGLCVICHECV